MQSLIIDRKISYNNDAANSVNNSGNFSSDRIMEEWNFKELALDLTNQYTTYIDTTSTIALDAGGLKLTTAATDTKTASYTFGGLAVKCAQNPTVEFKFKIDVKTTVAINAGFADATSYGSSVLPFTIATTTVSDNTLADGAMFAFDTGATTARWYAVNDKAGTQAGVLLSATQAPFTAATNLTIRVSLDTLGNATYVYNGQIVGYVPTAVTTSVALIPYIGIRNNTASAHNLTLRYVRLWEDA